MLQTASGVLLLSHVWVLTPSLSSFRRVGTKMTSRGVSLIMSRDSGKSLASRLVRNQLQTSSDERLASTFSPFVVIETGSRLKTTSAPTFGLHCISSALHHSLVACSSVTSSATGTC